MENVVISDDAIFSIDKFHNHNINLPSFVKILTFYVEYFPIY